MPKNYAHLAFAAALATALACSSDDTNDTPAPSITTFTASPDALTGKADVTLTWDVAHATTIHIEPDLGDVQGVSLSTTVYRPTTFTLTATNAKGAVTATAQVSMTLEHLDATVDTSLTPQRSELSAGRALATSKDAAGAQSDFVLDEVRIRPRNQAELDAFIGRHSGTIVSSDAVPAAPPELQVDAETPAVEYLVKIDSSTMTLDTLTTDAAAAGLGGAIRFSSDRALAFFAVVMNEAGSGLRVAPNNVSYGASILFHTQEQPAGAGTFLDTFNATQFPRLQNDKSKPSVVQAWQWMQAHGVTKRTRVAIIDGGFNVDNSGLPVVTAGDQPEFDAPIPQYDFVSNDSIATGTSSMTCTGGSPCPYHGTGTSSVAVGKVNNQGGAAGTGGTVASAMLFSVDGSSDQIHRAVRTATKWGADVVNLSLGGACDVFCRMSDRDDDAYIQARDAGVVVVAAAGNSNETVDGGNFYHPCIEDGVICVGSVSDTNTKIGSSNFGGSVDIWAPTDHVAAPDPTTGGANNPDFNGTSAASPFIAGIVAMVKAVDPTLNSQQVRDLLDATGWHDSPDALVTVRVNALAAVQMASQKLLPADGFEPNNDQASAHAITSATYNDLIVSSPTDYDVYTFTLAHQSLVELDLTFPGGIGKPYLGDGGIKGTFACGSAFLGGDTSTPDSRQLNYTLPQGTYYVTLGATSAIPYDMQLQAYDISSLARTPDAYESPVPNDGFAQASPIPDFAVIHATLTTAADGDFYKFTGRGSYTSGPLNMGTFIEVLSADAPLKLELFDTAGLSLGSSTTSADCKTRARLQVPPQNVVFKVTGSAAADYTVFVGGKITSVEQYIDANLYAFITSPGDVVTFPFLNPEVVYLFENNSDFNVDSLNLLTPGVHAQVLTLDGTLVSEGVTTDFQGTSGETVAVSTPTVLGAYLVKLTRVDVNGARAATNVGVTVNIGIVQGSL